MHFKGKAEVIKKVQNILGLAADGQDGPVTWGAILNTLSLTPCESTSSDKISTRMVGLAKEQIGVSEIDGTNCGPIVDEYKAATWLDSTKGWPWCAAFICWLVKEAIKDEDVSFDRPQTAGAWDFENWAKKQDGVELRKPTNHDVKAGDIVIFTFSHIGLAIKDVDLSGDVVTIEGNTNGAGSREGGTVLEKRRHISTIRSRIRII
tara:strand:- start:199 stop:816 length:618 start_codon:yes stop_codon:yes gene_type:complete